VDASEARGGGDDEDEDGEGGVAETAPTVLVDSNDQENDSGHMSQPEMVAALVERGKTLFSMRDVPVPDPPVR
jgi:hypothetical protein